MQQPYRWRCFACDSANEPAAKFCASCDFPARASGAQIAEARAISAAGSEPRKPPSRTPSGSIGDLFVGLGGWRKGLAIVGTTCSGIGVLGLKAMMSWHYFVLSALALAVGILMFGLAHLGAHSTGKQMGGHDG